MGTLIRFRTAINSLVRFVRRKWYWGIPFVAWELFKDRLENWANAKIDKNEEAEMNAVVHALEWVAGQPLFWTLIFVIIILVLVLLHSYFTDTQGRPSNSGKSVETSARKQSDLVNATAKIDDEAKAKDDLQDSEIVQIRSDVKRLVRMLGDYGSPEDQRQDVRNRLDRINSSDHAVWLDDKLAQSRVDFVHWCAFAQSSREKSGPTFHTLQERDETLFLLKDAANRIEASLTGQPIPSPGDPLSEDTQNNEQTVENVQETWADRDRLELKSIACLSLNIPLDSPMNKEPQLQRFRALKDCVGAKQLVTENNLSTMANRYTRILREDLRTFANDVETPTNLAEDLKALLGRWDTANPPKISPTDLYLRSREDKEAKKPIILVELETVVSPIVGFTPALAIRIKNTGPPLNGKCLVHVENHGLKTHMPDPFVARTEGQIRRERTGSFTLRSGQPKLVPILFKLPGHINEFRFIGEDGKYYDFKGDEAEFNVGIYGAASPTKVHIHFNVGVDRKIHADMDYC